MGPEAPIAELDRVVHPFFDIGLFQMLRAAASINTSCETLEFHLAIS
jgi:hypothetical protein